MSKTHNLLTINDRHYDALTGKPVADAPAPRPRNIDGIVSGPHPPARPFKTVPAAKPVSAPAANVRPAGTVKPHAAARHAPAHQAHPSKTLMRQAVRKPGHKLYISQLHAVAPAGVPVPEADAFVVPKLSFGSVDPKREAHARHVAKSKFISRFGDSNAPALLRPPAPAAQAADRYQTVAAPRPRSSRPAPHQRSMDIFERAVEQVAAHEQTPPSRKAHATSRRRAPRSYRVASVSLAALTVLLIGGFLTYQNMPGMTIHMASARAGFTASLPGYKPAGFSVGKFAYSPGHVTVNFRAADDGRHFALIEQPSGWDSATLLNDYVASAAKEYQTVQTGGRTIYLYGDGSATWVNGGVWYRIDGNNSLSTTQLVNLASSI